MKKKAVAAALVSALLLCGCADLNDYLVDKFRSSEPENSSDSNESHVSNERNFGYWDVGAGLLIADYHGIEEDVVIPETIHGKQVLGVNSNVFEHNVFIKRITLPDGAVLIDECAFSGCTELVEVTLPESMREIYMEAFADCKKLSKINIPSDIKFISYEAFTGCENIKAEYKGKIYDYDHIVELCDLVHGIT